MANLNRVMLIGNLTKDPDIRYTKTGLAVTNVQIAVNRTITKDNEKIQKTDYIDLKLWSKLAELLHKFCRKGSLIFVEGILEMESWDDKESNRKFNKIVVTVNNLQFLSKSYGQTTDYRPSSVTSKGSSEDDDIEF